LPKTSVVLVILGSAEIKIIDRAIGATTIVSR